jgi:hypothetical protein
MKFIVFLVLALAFVTASAFAVGCTRTSLAKVAVFTNFFNEADTNGDGILYFEEFSNFYGAGELAVITPIRFNALASFLNVEAGIRLRDFSSGHCDVAFVEHCVLTPPRNTPSKKVDAEFDCKDRDGSGFLDFYEFRNF